VRERSEQDQFRESGASPPGRESVSETTFLGHPIGLAYLAFTEAWERFAFYGMHTLLVLYMTRYLLLPGNIDNILFFDKFRQLYGGLEGQGLASAIYGTYAASVYLTPLLGGFLADRFLGRRWAVMLGGICMVTGHFLLAFEASFLFALLCLVLGSGLHKGNISSQVGSLYASDDLRRAGGFQVFFVMASLGVMAAPLVIGTLGEQQGWHFGFGAAGIGMAIGLAVYIAGWRKLPADRAPSRAVRNRAAARLERSDWRAITILLMLIPVIAVAVVPNNQIFNAYVVWADRQFDLQWGGAKLPTTWLLMLDAVVTVAFLAGVAAFYRWYGGRRREPDEITKMIIGSVFSVGGMLCLYLAAATQAPGEKIGLAWPAVFHLVNGIAFAHLFPVSLSLFSRVAPAAVNATMIGVYFLALFAGNALVGWVGSYFEEMPAARFWLLHAGFAAVSGFAFVLFRLNSAVRGGQVLPDR